MITSLYPKFQEWSVKGSVYIVSDTHFEDSDCKLMNPNWITPAAHMKNLQKITKNDTLIHLGDVGNPIYLNELKCHKVLISGNHDKLIDLKEYFDEVYNGCLFISDRLLLSHEPVSLPFCVNLHGHVHNGTFKENDLSYNFASDVVDFKIFSLGDLIKKGLLSKAENYHRITIDRATERKEFKK